jgi:site-specific recombinase XerD
MRDVQHVPIEKLTLDYLNKGNVLRFLQWVKDGRKCSNATRNYRLAAICSLAQYLQYEDIGHLSVWQQILSIKALKTEQRSINYLTVDGIKLLLEQPNTSTCKGRRNLALLALIYDTAARVQEIIDLTPDCIRIESRPYTIRLTGKGRKSRIIPLMGEQVDLLKNYMEEHHLLRPENRAHPLFYNSRHEKLTRAGISFILHTYVKLYIMPSVSTKLTYG